MSAELGLDLRSLRHGQHVCMFYDSPADTWAAVVPYFEVGLARGEQCLFAGSSDEARECPRVLASAGIDVEREVQRGALGITIPGADGFFGGHFDPQAEVPLLERLTEQALSDGFTGVRVAGEAPYALCGDVYDERRLFELELLIHEVIRRLPLVFICRFDLTRWRPSFVKDALRIHPLALIGPLVCPNVFYEPAQMALGRCSDDERVQWMIGQLYQSRSDKLALEQALRAREEFLGAASHELRTPLTSSRLFVQGVRQRAERSTDDRLSASWVSEKLQRAEAQMGRLAEIIQCLLDASRLGEGDDMNLHIEAVDLRDVVRDVIARFEEGGKHGCALRFDPSPEPIVGRWDRTRLEHVVTNVLSNAFKFGAGKPVELRLSSDGARARVVVQDRGIGIAAEDLPRIFDRFERGVPLRHYGGFGLGLWIAKKMVEALGGSITADGAPGAGATFTIEIPLNTSTEHAGVPVAATPAPSIH